MIIIFPRLDRTHTGSVLHNFSFTSHLYCVSTLKSKPRCCEPHTPEPFGFLIACWPQRSLSKVRTVQGKLLYRLVVL